MQIGIHQLPFGVVCRFESFVFQCIFQSTAGNLIQGIVFAHKLAHHEIFDLLCAPRLADGIAVSGECLLALLFDRDDVE